MESVIALIRGSAWIRLGLLLVLIAVVGFQLLPNRDQELITFAVLQHVIPPVAISLIVGLAAGWLWFSKRVFVRTTLWALVVIVGAKLLYAWAT